MEGTRKELEEEAREMYKEDIELVKTASPKKRKQLYFAWKASKSYGQINLIFDLAGHPLDEVFKKGGKDV